jgi:hypothetical protein
MPIGPCAGRMHYEYRPPNVVQDLIISVARPGRIMIIVGPLPRALRSAPRPPRRTDHACAPACATGAQGEKAARRAAPAAAQAGGARRRRRCAPVLCAWPVWPDTRRGGRWCADALSQEEYNDAADEGWKQTLRECPHCARRFAEERCARSPAAPAAPLTARSACRKPRRAPAELWEGRFLSKILYFSHCILGTNIAVLNDPEWLTATLRDAHAELSAASYRAALAAGSDRARPVMPAAAPSPLSVAHFYQSPPLARHRYRPRSFRSGSRRWCARRFQAFIACRSA